MLKPVHDYFMVEVKGQEDNPLGLVGTPDAEEGIREGRVVASGSAATFFGANTFMFDSSLLDEEKLNKLSEYYAGFVGKKVYWPERSESGAVIEHDGKTYAFIKWSSIMGVEGE